MRSLCLSQVVEQLSNGGIFGSRRRAFIKSVSYFGGAGLAADGVEAHRSHEPNRHALHEAFTSCRRMRGM